MLKRVTCKDCNGESATCETCLGEGTTFKYVTSFIDMDNRPITYGRAWRKPAVRKSPATTNHS